MIRNSTLYHRIWYVKRRNARKIRIYLRVVSIFIILGLLVSYANKNILPSLAVISEFKAKSMLTSTVNNEVQKIFNGDINYEDMVNVYRDSNGNISSIETNMARLNILSSTISASIQERLYKIQKESVAIPFGTLTGNSIFSGTGPALYIKIYPMGTVETDFISEFTGQEINQTKHSIYLQVKTYMRICAPLMNKTIEFTTSIPVAETVILGKVPDVYYRHGK